MKIVSILFALITFTIAPAIAQEKKMSAEEEAAYTKTITQRADKIVTTLGITDAAKATRVRDIIANQYRNLNNIHTVRDGQIKGVKAKGGVKEHLDAEIKNTEEGANASLTKLHSKYIADLSSVLTPQQVEQVKDGMTYGVVPITYKGYLDMIPTLKEHEKAQIHAWLIEARELAMDAESSEKKHWWFGKYKGKINNYLSAQGYNTQKEREEWDKRRKAAEAAKKN